MKYRSKYKKENKPKKTYRQKIRFGWRLFKILLFAGIIAFIGLWYYTSRLDRLIEEKFDQPRKWNLPSRVFSDAEHLYPGIDIKKQKIVEKLDRLGYRNTGQEIAGPGDYSLSDGSLDIYLHDFDYPLEKFKGFPVRIKLSDSLIEDIINLDSRESLALIKLEPEEISSIFDERMEDRTVVTLKDVPPLLLESIILMEDERFFKHRGVDPWGIIRAAIVNLTHLRIVQGGSTLTQQLVKNYFLYPKKSILRKLNEMLIAIEIERHHTKGEILEAYINEIYLGQRGSSSVSGVAEASKYYFAKNVNQLTSAECALLAGMIRLPNFYNPLTNKDRALERRNFVLKRLYESNLITKQQYEEARAEEIITPKPTVRAGRAPYFIDFVKQQLADLYPQEILQSEGLRIFTTLDMTMQLEAERAVQIGLDDLEKKYASILPKGEEGKLQGVLIAMQPGNGYLRALVGGRRYQDSQFNRATQARRQPGSAFKPFVYLTAFDPARSKRLFTPASVINDASFTVKSGGKNWSPSNYDKKEYGDVTLRKALEKSLNIATSKLAIEAGLEEVVKTAKDAGIKSRIDPVPSLALGSFEVTPMELASAYTVFPNGGIVADPISIMHVVTADGQVLEKESIKMKRVFDAGPVYLTTALMKGVIDHGTAAAARGMGFTGIAAGKTGTTSNYKDAWFVGFTPDFLALTWVGYDDNAAMDMSGSRAALPIWVDFMKQAAPAASRDFSSPSNIILVKIDPQSGLLSNRKCPDYIEEVFIEGTEPAEHCGEEKQAHDIY
jgi:penicillin-binding protein 1B